MWKRGATDGGQLTEGLVATEPERGEGDAQRGEVRHLHDLLTSLFCPGHLERVTAVF